MLGLENTQALLDKSHPVCLEYPPDEGDVIIRVFPDKGVNSLQVFTKHTIPTSETAQFLVALGELRLFAAQKSPEHCWPVQTDVPHVAGKISSWRLGPNGDNLREAPYFVKTPESPSFNRLFAALYDLIFSKMTNMGRLIPGPDRSLKEIFKEKIYGTDYYLVSAELIAYLKWLIYITPFKDRGNVAHEAYYHDQLAFLQKPSNAAWRGLLYTELQAWYEQN